MSKKSVYQRNLKRIKICDSYRARREKLKMIIKDKNSSAEQVFNAGINLQQLPRDASPVRKRNRCFLSGRARGVLPKYGVSRICFRLLARNNELPGIEKASW